VDVDVAPKEVLRALTALKREPGRLKRVEFRISEWRVLIGVETIIIVYTQVHARAVGEDLPEVAWVEVRLGEPLLVHELLDHGAIPDPARIGLAI
jgi:hypothetical protein